jgi:hypothetical protein
MVLYNPPSIVFGETDAGAQATFLGGYYWPGVAGASGGGACYITATASNITTGPVTVGTNQYTEIDFLGFSEALGIAQPTIPAPNPNRFHCVQPPGSTASSTTYPGIHIGATFLPAMPGQVQRNDVEDVYFRDSSNNPIQGSDAVVVAPNFTFTATPPAAPGALVPVAPGPQAGGPPTTLSNGQTFSQVLTDSRGVPIQVPAGSQVLLLLEVHKPSGQLLSQTSAGSDTAPGAPGTFNTVTISIAYNFVTQSGTPGSTITFSNVQYGVTSTPVAVADLNPSNTSLPLTPWVTPQCTACPALPPWGMATLLVGILGSGLYLVRKRYAHEGSSV